MWLKYFVCFPLVECLKNGNKLKKKKKFQTCVKLQYICKWNIYFFFL